MRFIRILHVFTSAGIFWFTMIHLGKGATTTATTTTTTTNLTTPLYEPRDKDPFKATSLRVAVPFLFKGPDPTWSSATQAIQMQQEADGKLMFKTLEARNITGVNQIWWIWWGKARNIKFPRWSIGLFQGCQNHLCPGARCPCQVGLEGSGLSIMIFTLWECYGRNVVVGFYTAHCILFFFLVVGGGYELQQLCLYLAVGFQGSTNNIPSPVSACLGQPFGLHLTGK